MTNYNQMDNTASLVLNFAPIDFADVEIPVGVISYKDKEQLQALRDNYVQSHFFYREYGRQILCVPVAADAPILGETSRVLRLKDKLDLCAALIRDKLKTLLFEKKREIIDYDPVSFIAANSKNDILSLTVNQFPNITMTYRMLCTRSFLALT